MSPIILPDTSSAEDMEVSESGTYRGTVVKTDAQPTKEKKVMQAIVSFKLPGVPDEKEKKPRDITRTAYMNIEGKGAMVWDKFLRCAGFSDIADRYRAGEKVPFNTDDLLGKEVYVLLKTGSYNDRRRDEIDGFLPI